MKQVDAVIRDQAAGGSGHSKPLTAASAQLPFLASGGQTGARRPVSEMLPAATARRVAIKNDGLTKTEYSN
jgi:hypothetical protein